MPLCSSISCAAMLGCEAGITNRRASTAGILGASGQNRSAVCPRSGHNRAVLLAVDVGNTQTHLGAFDGERLAEHWRFQTRSGATGDELAERIAGLFALCGMSLDEVDAVCVSSVVPPLGAQFEQLTERYLDARCLTIGPGLKTGMPIRIDNPLEVGAD